MFTLEPLIDSFNKSGLLSICRNPSIHAYNRDLEDILAVSSNKMFIAGGAARLWYENRNVGSHDIDIYFTNREDWNQCFATLNKKYTQTFSTENAITFNVGDKYKIQLIKNQFSPDPYKIIENFDISVCQIATDGTRWYMGKNFAHDLQHRLLRFEKVTPKFLKRYIKYQAYGFKPVQTLSELEEMCNEPVVWDFSTINDLGDYDAN